MAIPDQVLRRVIAYQAPDLRRVQHAVKVYGYARVLGVCEELPSQQRLILELAAALHDIGIHAAEKKYGSAAGRYQEKEGPAIAREQLAPCGFSPEVVERVCQLIGRHHTYSGIDGLDCQLLIESDFLVNIEEDH